MTTTFPYGSWPSPISAAQVAASSPRFEGARFVGDEVWWGQSVPEEGGRTTVRRRAADGTVTDLLAAPWNARSAVHEYGGGAWTATDDGTLLFVEKTDQRVCAVGPGEEPRVITRAGDGVRFGGLSWQDGRLLAVRETHGGAPVPWREIVTIGIDGGVAPLVGGSDFLAQPALSPTGRYLAWIAWNHPDMPWDRTELRVGRVDGDTVAEWTTVAGGDTASLQPVWASDEELVFTDDATGRWNLQRVHIPGDEQRHPIAPADADTGGALWVLGLRWFARLDDGRIVAIRTNGSDEVVIIDPAGDVTPLPLDAAWNTVVEDAQGTSVLVSTAGARGSAALWLIDVDRPYDAELLAGGDAPWGDEWMSQARAVTFDGPHGPVHAFDYPPTHPEATAPAGELPPYVVFVHGGPTSHVGGAASGKIAYLTSRGIGVLDVNYGGSTGYGRAYRERLRGQWGVVDVDDVITAARGLADAGIADPARLAIAGGSAGGWTVLCALTASDVFGAGISRYGVADLRRLAADTHDFEARYLDGLVGPLPEAEDVYVARSPLSHLDRFTTPLLIEQGLDDLVVPPSQSEAVRDALAANGVPYAYLTFEGEGHGFRRAETVVRTLEAEVAFLGQVFGFETPGLPPVDLRSAPVQRE